MHVGLAFWVSWRINSTNWFGKKKQITASVIGRQAAVRAKRRSFVTLNRPWRSWPSCLFSCLAALVCHSFPTRTDSASWWSLVIVPNPRTWKTSRLANRPRWFANRSLYRVNTRLQFLGNSCPPFWKLVTFVWFLFRTVLNLFRPYMVHVSILLFSYQDERFEYYRCANLNLTRTTSDTIVLISCHGKLSERVPNMNS